MSDNPNPNTPIPASAVQWATFPVCCECGRQKVPRVSDAPIYVQRGDEPAVKLHRGLSAATTRFLGQVDGAVPWDHIYQAIGSHEVDHGLAPLRKLLGKDAIQPQSVLKETQPGTYGAYSFAPNIRVWEPREGEDDHGNS